MTLPQLLAYFGVRRPLTVLVTDPAGAPMAAAIGPGLELRGGVLSATGTTGPSSNGGSSGGGTTTPAAPAYYEPLTNGSHPDPQIVFEFGDVIMVKIWL